MAQKELLLGHMDDLAGRATKTGLAASRFLTPADVQSVASHFSGRHDVTLTFDGGYDSAERVRAVFLNPDWGGYDRADLFAALKIAYRPADTLGHRDILGAVMALGIKRETIGDIIAEASPPVLVCLPELGEYIVENLTKIGRIGVSVSKLDISALPVREASINIQTDTVASLRLDVVLCAAFGLSRTKAAELISAGRVSLNHEPCLHPAKELCEGALLSVRGVGRAKLLEVGGISRKGRIFVRLGLYGQ